MDTFQIYLDASGNPDDPQAPALSVAGFIATVEQWTRCETKWNAVLDRYGVTELHMKHLAHFRGQYCNWKNSPHLRDSFLKDLIDVLRLHVCNSFACTVWLSNYQEANTDGELRPRLSPLAVAGICCIERIQRWADRHRIPQSNLRYFIEDGDIDKGNLMLCAKILLAVDVVPLRKNKTNLFQTADLLAYENFQAAKQIIGRTRRVEQFSDLRKSFTALSQIPCGGSEMSDWSFKSGAEFTQVMLQLRKAMLEPEPQRF